MVVNIGINEVCTDPLLFLTHAHLHPPHHPTITTIDTDHLRCAFRCRVLTSFTTHGTETFSSTASNAADTHKSRKVDRDKVTNQPKAGQRLTFQIRSRKGGGIPSKHFQVNFRRKDLVSEVNLRYSWWWPGQNETTRST
jgi:hypothetical protein